MKKTMVILACTWAFWSCLKVDSPNTRLYEGAAIIKGLEAERGVLMVLDDLIMITPKLSAENLSVGDLLWVSMLVQDDKQIGEDTLFVSDIAFLKIEKCSAKPATGTPSVFTCPIDRAIMWRNHAGNFWVFEFEQIAGQGQIFEYEMQFEKKAGEAHPTAYLRSRKVNEVGGTNTHVVSFFGFDLTPLINEYANKEAGTLSFYVRLLSGFCSSEEEIFTPLLPGFITVNVKK